MSVRPSNDDVWQLVAEAVSKRSRCVRSQTGAVIVGANGRIVATGYNGPAAGFEPASYADRADTPCNVWCRRAMDIEIGNASVDYGNCPAIHAEANALLFAQRSDVEGGTIYITRAPCFDCCKLISNSGLVRVHFRGGVRADMVRDVDASMRYLDDCNIYADYTYAYSNVTGEELPCE